MEVNQNELLQDSKTLSDMVLKLTTKEEDALKVIQARKLLVHKKQEQLDIQIHVKENKELVDKFNNLSQKTLLQEADSLRRKQQELEQEIENIKAEKETLGKLTKVTRKALQTAISTYKQIFNMDIESVQELSEHIFKVKVQYNNKQKEAAINLIIDRLLRKVIGFEAAPTRPLTDEEHNIIESYIKSNSENFGDIGVFLRSLLLK